jgi:hypothetical protein
MLQNKTESASPLSRLCCLGALSLPNYCSVQCWQKSLLEPLDEESRRKDLKKYLYEFKRWHEPGYQRPLADWEIRVRRTRRLANCRARIAAECESEFVGR